MTIERESLLNKIRALLAKTMEAGCTEEEAMTAVTKAHAMMDAYAVTDAELNLTKEEKAILRREPPGTKDPHRIKWFLVNAVGDFCNCKGWRLRRDRGGGIVFCGLPSDAQFASWLLDTLAAFVQAEIFKFLIEAQPSNEDRVGARPQTQFLARSRDDQARIPSRRIALRSDARAAVAKRHRARRHGVESRPDRARASARTARRLRCALSRRP